MKWFCRSCWRSGEFAFDLPLEEAERIAEIDHSHIVDLDMRASKVPAGMQEYRNSPIMEKYPSVYCDGDIKIGDPPLKRVRFDDKDAPKLKGIE